MRVLVPVDMSSPNCDFALKHVVNRFMNDSTIEIHLLNVQPKFSHDISRFTNARTLHEYHREESEKALRPCMRMLDNFNIPYGVHMEVGDTADCIAETAKRLHCDEIVMSTAHKNSLVRLVENSVTNRVLERSSVPVEVVPGKAESPWERYGIPAALAGLVALMFAAAD